MKIAYFDCYAGAGGDMIVAAMLDAGVDAGWLCEQIDSLGIDGLDVEIAETVRGGMRGVSFRPSVSTQQPHRNLADILELVGGSGISETAKKRVGSVFTALAEAEAHVHGKEVDQIHFHEVGAVDSIVDIVAACVGIEALGAEKVLCSVISVGGGTVTCQHGIMPVPAPATAELIKRGGVPIQGGPIDKELFTPTAAAILTNFTSEFGPMPPMKIAAVGCGAGTHDAETFANLLRLTVGEAVDTGSSQTDHICLLETNIDDVSGEVVGFVVERLLEAGGLDVYTTPIFMKHNRPAVKLSVICRPQDAEMLEKIIFAEGISLGIRRQILQRNKIMREIISVDTKYGKIAVKIASVNGKIVSAKPEYSECVESAKRHDIALKIVQRAAIDAYGQSI